MLRCTRCEGFIPVEITACPNCSKFVPRTRAGRGFLAVVGAGAAAITLMACYGMPPCDRANPDGGAQLTGCAHIPEHDGGTSDAGQTTDAGTCDGGTGAADGGC